jgi:hypothetical protein
MFGREELKMEEWTVVKYLGESKESGLTKGKEYGVETDEDLVGPEIYNDFGCVTVWDDKGHLHEIEEDEYEVVTVSEKEWWKTVPRKRYLEYL